MDEKIELVQAHRQRYGLNACLRAVGLSKGTWHYRRHRKSQAERDAALKAEIVSVIEANPDYGAISMQSWSSAPKACISCYYIIPYVLQSIQTTTN